MKEVAPDIFMITEKENSRFIKFAVNVFVIAGSNGLIFDAGYGKKKASRYLATRIKSIEDLMQKRGKECRITRVLPSHGHWDHFSGITKLRKNLGVKVLATEKMLKSICSKREYINSFKNDKEIINVPESFIKTLWHKLGAYLFNELSFRFFGIDFISGPVEIIEENSTICIDNKTWELIALPGHCDDAIGLYNKEQGILLGGDTILRKITTWIGPPRSDLGIYIKSLEYLLTLPDLKIILPAHGSPIKEPFKRINQAIAYRKKRTEDILNLIQNAGKTGINFKIIFKTIYPAAKFHEKFILRGWILTTLEYLLEQEMITRSPEGKNMVFRIK